MKKSVSLLLIAAFLMLLVSCTGNSYVISDTQDSTENSTETVIEETTDIPPQVEPTPDRILDDDGFVHTSSGEEYYIVKVNSDLYKIIYD